MIAFLIKSALSLALLLVVYRLVLQREKMHGFNRFYLLFALCFSLVIPFIQFEATPEALAFPGLQEFTGQITEAPIFVQESETPVVTTNFLPYILWTIYLAGALLMLIRFTYHLLQLRSVIKNNTVKPYGNARLVLVDHPVTPHSFLNYIFFSRKEYENNLIEEALLQHELTHIKQKHSLDILLIEVLGIIFWFNPVILLYRKAIKLNHEFLADEAVIRARNDVPSYQQLLLSKIFMNRASGLASPVNYSLTKKRLLMMSKNTSYFKALALQTAMVPLFTIVMVVCCTKVLAQVKPPPSPPPAKNEKPDVKSNPPKVVSAAPWTKIKNQDSIRALKERYYGSKPEIEFGWIGADGQRVRKRWVEMTEEEKQAIMPPPPPPKRMYVTQEQLDEWSSDPKTYGIWIDGYRKKNEVLKKYKPEDFGHYTLSRLHKNAVSYKEHKVQLNITTVDKWKEWRKQSIKDLGLDQEQ